MIGLVFTQAVPNARAAEACEESLNAFELRKKVTEALFSDASIDRERARGLLDQLTKDAYFFRSKQERIEYLADHLELQPELKTVGAAENIHLEVCELGLSYRTALILNSQWRNELAKVFEYWRTMLADHQDESDLAPSGKKYWSDGELNLLYSHQLSPAFRRENFERAEWTKEESSHLKLMNSQVFVTPREAAIDLAQAVLDGSVAGTALEVNPETGKLEVSGKRVAMTVATLGTAAAFHRVANIEPRFIGTPPRSKGRSLLRTKARLGETIDRDKIDFEFESTPEYVGDMGAMGIRGFRERLRIYASARFNRQLRKIIAAALHPEESHRIVGLRNANVTLDDVKLLMTRYGSEGLPEEVFDAFLASSKPDEYLRKLIALDYQVKNYATAFRTSRGPRLDKYFGFAAWFLRRHPELYWWHVRIRLAGGTARQALFGQDLRAGSDLDTLYRVSDAAVDRVGTAELTSFLNEELNTYIAEVGLGTKGADGHIAHARDRGLRRWIEGGAMPSIDKTFIKPDGQFELEFGGGDRSLSEMSRRHAVQAIQDLKGNGYEYMYQGRLATAADMMRIVSGQSNVKDLLLRSISYQLELRAAPSTRSYRELISARDQQFYNREWSDVEKLNHLFHDGGWRLMKQLERIDQVVGASRKRRAQARAFEQERTVVYLRGFSRTFTFREIWVRRDELWQHYRRRPPQELRRLPLPVQWP